MAPSGTHLQCSCGGWAGTICTRNMSLGGGGHKVTKDAMGEALISVGKATKGKSKGQQEEK